MPSTATSILDGLSTSVAVKAPVKVASTTNLTLSGEQTIDGVACVEGDRVLVKDQSTASENGIYVVSTGSWTRAKDFDGNRDVRQGTLVVLGVTGSTGIYYRVTSSNPIVIGTSAINFEIVGGALTQSIIADLLFPYDSDIVNGTLTPTAVARFYAVEEITDHAHYAFLDDSLIEYAGGSPVYGHASFNANVTIRGAVDSDHHNGFQAYPHIELDDDTVTINDVAGFFSRGDLVGGTVLEWSHFRVEEPTNAGGLGDISNHYGYYCAELDLASGNNYAFFSEGRTKSCLGGDLQLGVPATPATVRYNYDTGNLDLIPRADAGNAYNIFANAEYLYIGDADIATAASLRNAGSGDLEITARTGFVTKMKSPTQVEHPMKLPAYTVAQLGSSVLPGDWTDCICICSNETGGRTLVFSDGTNWKRVSDLANIS